jgi:hypothetical protein
MSNIQTNVYFYERNEFEFEIKEGHGEEGVVLYQP